MRTDQWIGLNRQAESFLENHFGKIDVIRTLLESVPTGDGRVNTSVISSQIQTRLNAVITKASDVSGAWTEVVGELKQYSKFSVPNIPWEFEEFVQAEPWSSGPMYFLALKRFDGTVVEESLWTENEMGEH